jgi:hypothetical protein
MLHLSFLRDNPRLVAFGDGRSTGRKRMIHMVVCTRMVLKSDFSRRRRRNYEDGGRRLPQRTEDNDATNVALQAQMVLSPVKNYHKYLK